MYSPLKKLLTAAGCWLALSALAPAHAGIIVGTFDPAFGRGFTGLGWMGEVRIDVPDACLALSSGNATNAECQGAQMVGAYVRLYDLADPTKYEVLEFMSPTLRLHLDDLTISDQTLSGIYTSLEHYNTVSNTWTDTFSESWLKPLGLIGGQVDPRYALYRYGLAIDGDLAFLSASAINLNPLNPDPLLIDPAFGCPYDGDYAICNSETSPYVTFTPLRDPPVDPPVGVPEPASLALVGGALVAAAWTRRRQPRARG